MNSSRTFWLFQVSLVTPRLDALWAFLRRRKRFPITNACHAMLGQVPAVRRRQGSVSQKRAALSAAPLSPSSLLFPVCPKRPISSEIQPISVHNWLHNKLPPRVEDGTGNSQIPWNRAVTRQRRRRQGNSHCYNMVTGSPSRGPTAISEQPGSLQYMSRLRERERLSCLDTELNVAKLLRWRAPIMFGVPTFVVTDQSFQMSGAVSQDDHARY